MSQTSLEDILAEAQQYRVLYQYAKAANLYKHALEEYPSDNNRILYEWASMAFERGNYKNAQQLLQKVIANDNDHVEALSKIGAVYAVTFRFDLAVQALKRALRLDPSHQKARNNLALAYLETGKNAEAVETCVEGIKLNKDYPPLYIVLGKAQRELGRADEALEAMKTAVELDGDGFEALFNLGVLYADMGDREKAFDCLEKALNINPGFVQAHKTYSAIHKYEENDPHIKTLESLIGIVSDDYESALVHFALGKAFEDTGQFDKAGAHYVSANDHYRKTYDYDVNRALTNFSRISDAFKSVDFEARALDSDPDFAPIFIVGLPRSGSTLAEQILAETNEVSFVGERRHFLDLQFLEGDINFNTYEDDIKNMKLAQLEAMAAAYKKTALQYNPDTQISIDKSLPNFFFIGLIRLLFPNAKIIHCRRDPMDHCASIYKKQFTGHFPYAYNQHELAVYYKAYTEFMNFWHEALPGFIFDLHYEEMVDDPEKVSKSMFSFCDLPWDPACLEFYKSKRAVKTASVFQVRKPIYKDAVGSAGKLEEHLSVLKENLIF